MRDLSIIFRVYYEGSGALLFAKWILLLYTPLLGRFVFSIKYEISYFIPVVLRLRMLALSKTLFVAAEYLHVNRGTQ